LINNWLCHVQDVRDKYRDVMQALPSEQARVDRLCELNVMEQVRHVCQTTIVQDCWARGQELSVHGWVYDVADGLLRDLGLCITSLQERDGHYDRQVADLVSQPVRSVGVR
jgi:carbonic anhydrase